MGNGRSRIRVAIIRAIHGGRHVWPERGSTSPDSGSTKRRIVGGIEGTETTLEDVGELEDRRRDHRKPKDFEAVEHPARQGSTSGGLFGEEVTHAGRKRMLE